MDAIFGAIVGFIASLWPDILQMLKDRFAHQRDLESNKQALDAAARGYEYSIQNQNAEIAKQQEQIAKLTEVLSENTPKHWFLEYLRSSVRPALTYGFFFVWAFIKLSIMGHALAVEHVPVMQVLPLVWNGDAESLFAAVVTFWFGSRMRQPSKSDDTPVKDEQKQIVTTLAGHNDGIPVVGE